MSIYTDMLGITQPGQGAPGTPGTTVDPLGQQSAIGNLIGTFGQAGASGGSGAGGGDGGLNPTGQGNPQMQLDPNLAGLMAMFAGGGAAPAAPAAPMGFQPFAGAQAGAPEPVNPTLGALLQQFGSGATRRDMSGYLEGQTHPDPFVRLNAQRESQQAHDLDRMNHSIQMAQARQQGGQLPQPPITIGAREHWANRPAPTGGGIPNINY